MATRITILGLLLCLVGACTDDRSRGPASPEEPTAVLLSPQFDVGAAEISAIRVVVYRGEGQDVLAESRTPVEPDAESWDVEVGIELPSRQEHVTLTLELLSVSLDGETVEWSGTAGPFGVASFEVQKRVYRVPLGRGPLTNLQVTALELGELPSSLLVEDEVALAVRTEGGPEDPVVYWSVADPSVAQIVGNRLIALAPGTADLTARVGRREAVGSIEILERPANTAPVATSFRASTDEDVPLTVTLTGSDAEGDDLEFDIVTPPAHGSLGSLVLQEPSEATVVYTPGTGFVGEDLFVYRVSDGRLDSEVARVDLVVRSGDSQENNPPFAQPTSAVTTRGQAVVLTLSGADVDGDRLTFRFVSPPAFGQLGELVRLGPQSVRATYAPAADFVGTDEFLFSVSDGQAESLPARVDLAVIVESLDNKEPIAEFTSVVTPRDVPVEILLSGTDADGDALEFEISSPPGLGALGALQPVDDFGALVLYTPPAGFSGTDEFGFIVSDGAVQSEEAVVRITIDPPSNSSPSALPVQVSTDQGIPRVVTLVATDPDGDDLEFRLAGGPIVGRLGPITPLDGARAEVVYTPPAGFSGQDRFTFTAFDGQLTSSPAPVDVTVREVGGGGNRAPRVQGVLVSTRVDTPVSVLMTGSDADGDPLSFEVRDPPAHGSLGEVRAASARTGEVFYTPDPGFEGTDSFTFLAFDGVAHSDAGTVLVSVEPPENRPPVANTRDATVTAGAATGFTLTGSDPDGDALVFSVVEAPEHGTLDAGQSTGDFTYALAYTPDTDFLGDDSFLFQVSDGELDSEPARVSLTVVEPPEENVAPVAAPASATTTRETPVTLTLAGSDGNGDELAFSIQEGPTNGTLGDLVSVDGTTVQVEYTPASGFEGTEIFTFTVSDGELTSPPAEVTVVVQAPPNAPPSVLGGSVEVEAGESVTISLTGSDPDDDPLTFDIDQAPQNGSLGTVQSIGPSTAEVTYTPEPGFSGGDAFTFTANDGQAGSEPASVTIDVLPTNAAPVVEPVSAALLRDTSVELILAGSDADGDPITFEIAAPPTNGSVSDPVSLGPTTASVTYTPDASFFGMDAFTFRAMDGREFSSVATATLEVRETNAAPTANSFEAGTAKNQPVTLVLQGADADGDLLNFSITGGPASGSLGAMSRIADDAVEIVYTPAGSYDGADAFTFTVDDGIATSAEATVDLTVSTPGTLIFIIPDPAVIDAIDGTLEVKVRAIGPKGTPVTLPNVRLSSTDESVFTVTKTSDSTAVIRGVGNGEADVIVKSGSTTKTSRVTVAQVTASVEILHEGSEARLAVGETIQFTAVPKDRNGYSVPGRTATWESGNPGLLTVATETDLIGIGTAHEEGTVTVTVTVDGVTATLEVVIDP